MNGKDAIIEKIIGDATAQAQEALLSARRQADVLLQEAENQCHKAEEDTRTKVDGLTEQLHRRRKTVAELEVKKQVLAERKRLIDNTFTAALDKLSQLPQKDYSALVGAMILSVCEDGDEVLIAEKDKALITQAFLDNLTASRKIKLTLAKGFGDFKGGVILQSPSVDKNLTFEVELAALRNTMEPQIATLLFGAK